MKPYKAKSLKAAERAVRSLTKQCAERDDRERKMLAKLAIRDLILASLEARGTTKLENRLW